MGFTGFLIAITIVCFLLIIAIMVQNPKGGGLSSSFGGSQQLGGVQKTTDFLDKSTWTLGGILITLILLSTLAFPGGGGGDSKVFSEEELQMPKTEIPATPEATQKAAETTTTTPVETTEEAK